MFQSVPHFVSNFIMTYVLNLIKGFFASFEIITWEFSANSVIMVNYIVYF